MNGFLVTLTLDFINVPVDRGVVQHEGRLILATMIGLDDVGSLVKIIFLLFQIIIRRKLQSSQI